MPSKPDDRSWAGRLLGFARAPDRASQAAIFGATATGLAALSGCALITPAPQLQPPESPAARDQSTVNLARGILFDGATAPATAYDSKTGLTAAELAAGSLPSPFRAPFTVGAGFSDYQFYPTEGRSPATTDAHYGDYVHAGLDLRAPAGTPVHAIKGGKVSVNKAGRFHTGVTVREVGADGKESGRRWDYAHLNPDNIPEAVQRAAKEGKTIPAGTHLGDVASWLEGVEGIPDQINRSDGKRYDHLHLNVIVRGANGRDHYHNLLGRLGIPDSVRPTIEAVHFVPDGATSAFAGEVPAVRGKTDVVIEAHDKIDGGTFPLGVHAARITVEAAGAPGREVFRTELPPFDQVTGAGGGIGDVHRQVYLRELEVGGKTERARGNRFGRKSFLVVTNVRDGAADARGSWDTTKHPDGEYTVTVTVRDAAGNETSTSRAVRVDNR